MNDFDKVFASDIVEDIEFDTIIGAAEDGELIDTVGQNSLFTESGEDVTDVDEPDDDEDEDEEDVEESVEDIANLNVLDENAKFSFWPRFRQVPEMRRYERDIREAEDLLNYQGEPTKATALKIMKCAIRILDICYNINSVLYIPMMLFIVTIPAYLLLRGCEYLLKLGEHALAESYGEKVISKLHKIENNTKDPKVKKKCREQIEKVSKSMHKIKAEEYDESFSFDDDLEMFSEDAFDDNFFMEEDSVVGTADLTQQSDDFEDDDFADSDFPDEDDDDFEMSSMGLQAFNEKPYYSNCESEIDSPEESDDIDQAMADDDEATVQDIRDIEDEPQPYGEDYDMIFGEGAEDFEDEENMTNDEDLSPDSEGALDDGDDIDSLEEVMNLML